MDSINVVLSQSSYNLLLDLLKIAPTLLELAQDVAKNDEKTALHGFSDTNLKTQAESAFTETNHTDFILNSPGEYKSPRRSISNEEIYEYLNKLDNSLAGLRAQVSSVDLVSSGIFQQSGKLMDVVLEVVKQLEELKAESGRLVNQIGYLGIGHREKLKGVLKYCSSLDERMESGFNESINAIQRLEAGVNFKFSDEMADHLGGIFTELKAIKEKVELWGKSEVPPISKGSTLNPMYPVDSFTTSPYTLGNAPAVIWNPFTDPLSTQQTLPVQPLLTHKVSEPLILMEDVFQQVVVDEQDARNEAAFARGLELLGNIGAFD